MRQHMIKPSLGCAVFLAALAASLVVGAWAQGYPSRPIQFVTAEAGGGNDLVTRIIAQGIAGPLGQPVVVINRTGIIAVESVPKAAPDGHTLLLFSGSVWLMPFIQNVSYDPLKDLAPITLAASAPNLVAINPTVAASTIKELIALAKSKPGVLNYGSTVTGGSAHLAAELFNTMAGVNIVRINYKGSAAALNDLMSGQVHVAFIPVGLTAPHVKSGRLKALAVTSAQPSALFPGLVTVAAAGLPGYEAVSSYGVFAPAKTPASIIARLNREMVSVLNQPGPKEKLFTAGAEVVASSPDELAVYMRSDMDRMGRVIKRAGIRAN